MVTGPQEGPRPGGERSADSPEDGRRAGPAQAHVPGRFEEIYDAYVVPIYRFIYARVGNRPDAEDLAAQVFLRAVEQLDTDRPEGQIVAWLYRVSQNLVADYWRAFYRLPIVASGQPDEGWEPAASAAAAAGGARQGSGDSPAGGQARERVESLLALLPENYRRVLELRFIQRLSIGETAERMGITRGNAKVLQYRALRRAALLGEGGDG
jgi:RNA polymerase sigma-70 factor (ECF subfamily)